MPTKEITPQKMLQKLIIQEIERRVSTMPENWMDQIFSVNEMNLLEKMYTHIIGCSDRAYVQFRGSEFHTRYARSRQPQEQRRAKAHSRQAKLDRLKLFSRLGLKPQAIICRP